MEQFEKFATENKIEMTATRIHSRPDWESRADIPDPVHFQIVLSMPVAGKMQTLWAGQYSQGIGNAERWAKANKSKFIGHRVGQAGHGYPMREALEQGPGRGKAFRPESNYWENIREQYARSVSRQKPGKEILPAADILLSLQMDIMGADQHYEDWAADLGYDEDSRKGHAIWETCNTIRRDLVRALGGKFAEFEELRED